jgi:hypothetical protein
MPTDPTVYYVIAICVFIGIEIITPGTFVGSALAVATGGILAVDLLASSALGARVPVSAALVIIPVAAIGIAIFLRARFSSLGARSEAKDVDPNEY